MTTIQIELPDATAHAARDAGLLTPLPWHAPCCALMNIRLNARWVSPLPPLAG